MPTQQGGKWRRQNGKLTQVSEPTKEQKYGAHAVHPSKVKPSESKAVAPAAVPSKANTSAAKSSTNVKGKDDADTATNT